jgi:hypothetical protein
MHHRLNRSTIRCTVAGRRAVGAAALSEGSLQFPPRIAPATARIGGGGEVPPADPALVGAAICRMVSLET